MFDRKQSDLQVAICLKLERNEKDNERGMGIKGEKMNLDIIICFQGIVNTEG